MAKIGIGIGHGENTWETTGGKGVYTDNGHWEEFWFNEKVGKYVYYALLEHGFDVVLPQKWDENEVSLYEKSSTFNEEDTDLNVCIHANAGVEGAEGACVFYWDGSVGGEKFADLWVKNFQELCPEQGLHGDGQHISDFGKWTNFHMIRETDGYTALIEHGFFTNEDQLENLKNPDFQKRAGKAIVKSVCEYFGVPYNDDKCSGATITTASVEDSNGVNYEYLTDEMMDDAIGYCIVDAEALWYYGSADWNDKVDTMEGGSKHFVKEKLEVDGYYMYQTVQGNYFTANEEYVTFYPADSDKLGYIFIEAQELWYYGSANWEDKVDTVTAGEVFTVVDELYVDGYKMYKLKSGAYITANEEYVTFQEQL